MELKNEASNAMLTKAKLSLRVSNNAFDDEITNLIESAKIDLILAGVKPEAVGDNLDAMVERAILTYCRAHFGMANPDSDKYAESYGSQRSKLAVSGIHNVL